MRHILFSNTLMRLMTMINKLQSWKHCSANHLTKYLPVITWLYVVRNQENQLTVAINWPFSNKNEHFSRNLCEKLEFYTNGKVKFNIPWARSKGESLLEIKDNVKHVSCIIYQEICSCGHNYTSETIRNVVTRKDENEQPHGKSEPSKHLKNNPGHKFDWMILLRPPSDGLKRKILETSFIRQLNPSLNDQLDSEDLILFRHSVT